MAAQQFDVGQFLACVRDRKGIRARIRFGEKSLEQGRGAVRILERAVQIRQRQNDLARKQRLIVIFLQNPLRAQVDHALGGGRLWSPDR